MKNGFLINNLKAIDFVTWYLANPLGSTDQKYARQALAMLKCTHLPAFRNALSCINKNIDGACNFKTIDIFSSHISNENIPKRFMNTHDHTISVRNYLKFLKSQKLVPTKSIVPLAKKVNLHSVQKAKSLLAMLYTYIPDASADLTTLYTEKRNDLHDNIRSDCLSVDHLKRAMSHWYTKSDKRTYIATRINQINRGTRQHLKKLQNLDAKYHKSLHIIQTLAHADRYLPNIADYFEQQYLSLSSQTWNNHKHCIYNPFTLRFCNGCVKVFIISDGSKSILKTKILKHPTAFLAIQAIYETISNLPYLRLSQIPDNQSFSNDLTYHLFKNKANLANYYMGHLVESKHTTNYNLFSNPNCIADYKKFILSKHSK